MKNSGNAVACMVNAPARERACKRCGKPFVVQYPHFAKCFCSDACRKDARSGQNRAQYLRRKVSIAAVHLRNCKRCGNEFQAMYTQGYCDDCLTSGDPYMTQLMWRRKAIPPSEI